MASEAIWSNARWGCGCERYARQPINDFDCEGSECVRDPSRRSAPQPPVVLSAEGREIRVGDRVAYKHQGKPGELHATVSLITSKHKFNALRDDGHELLDRDARLWRHADVPPPTAQSDEGGGATTCDKCGDFVMRSKCSKVDGDDVCPKCLPPKPPAKSAVGIDWVSVGKGTILASDALSQVEHQLALVARLDFDLRMLKLLGQGWSRNDLLADLSRKAKQGPARKGEL